MTLFLPGVLGDLTGRQRLFAVTLLVVAATLLVTLWTSGKVAAILVGLALAATLFITQGVWLPENYGRTRVRLASLAVVTSLAASLGLWKPFVGEPIARLIAPYVPPPVASAVASFGEPSDLIVGLFLGFALLVVVAVNYFSRDATVMGQAQASRDPDFPERDYRQKAAGFCKALEAHHHNLDLETQWSPAKFVQLDAEVETSRSRHLTPRVTNLLAAIRGDRRTRLFLIIGDPGSGKSIALRRLAVDLLKEFPRTGRIPVYVNLKEWRPPAEAELTARDFHLFVKQSLLQHIDVYGQEFVTAYFDRLVEHGRLFFIIDSFDEMTRVMDSRESSTTIASLSAMLSVAFSGATETRGVLASRIFRRPTLAGPHCRTLEIRPFSDLKIAQALKNSFQIGDRTIMNLFRSRPDLVSLARNPFCAELLRVYLEENDQQLPVHQGALFSHYVDRQLARAAELMAQAGVTSAEVVDAATNAAYAMYTSADGGLETPVQLLASQGGSRMGAIADILLKTRLARMGLGLERRFSFVHRRFHEFFVARRFSADPTLFPFESIPQDSRWRDALVMYCETAGSSAASEIAARCWAEIEQTRRVAKPRDIDLRLRAVHCLRFLRDAFGTRRECTESFRAQLTEHIVEEVAEGDLLEAKLALEGVGILDESGVAATLQKGFERDNEWLNETALRSCRQLPRIDSTLENAVGSILSRKSYLHFRSERRDLLFSFQLSDGFHSIYRYCRLRSRWTLAAPWAAAVCVLLAPVSALIGVMAYASVRLWIRAMQALAVNLLEARSRDERSEAAEAAARLGRRLDRLVAFESVALFSGIGIPCLALAVARALGTPARDSIAMFVGSDLLSGNSWSGGVFVVLAMNGLILAAPWADVWWVARRTSAMRVLKVLGTIVLVLMAYGAFLWALQFVIPHVPRVVSGALLVALCVLGLGSVLWGLAWAIPRWRRDRERLRNAVTGPVGSRADVASHFFALETTRCRWKYVEHLDEMRQQPSGDWPGGRVPNRGCRASTALARLEEQWRGLAR